jgi:nucleotide-binding universal stress UspA family protein
MTTNYQRILIPVDGSEGDQRVLALVGDLIQKHPIAITLIYVVEVQQSMPLDAELPEDLDRGEAILLRAEHLSRSMPGHKQTTVSTDLLQARTAGAAIVDESIERRADAVLIAARNRVRHGRVTMGDTVNYVLKNAPCDVIVVRLGANEPAR